MGITNLWTLLNTEGLAPKLEGAKGEHPTIMRHASGKAVAVDLSVWLMQATNQTATDGLFSEDGRALKVVFERTINWLRHDVTPIAVAEGLAPAEKLATLQTRSMALYGFARSSALPTFGNLQRMSQAACRLLDAMGLPTLTAPGEAEAAAAALNAAGHVDAAGTPDADALLFGATEVFHTLRLLTHSPHEAVFKRCQTAEVCRALGASEDAAVSALTAVALLCGGDYDEGGGAGMVGPRHAFAIVRKLIADAHEAGRDDGDVLALLAAELAAPPQLPEFSHLKGCTRCKRCGHDGHRQAKIAKHSNRNPCQGCPLTDDGSCAEASPLPEPCRCRFCSTAGARLLARVITRARATEGFMQRARTAERAYAQQAAQAAEAVADLAEEEGIAEGERLTWQRRPDVDAVHAVLSEAGLVWSRELVREKLCPLLLEWDARHPKQGAQFVPVEIKALQQQRGLTEADLWRYIMVWRRTRDQGDEDVEADTIWLSASTADARSARKAVIAAMFPQLVSAFHQKLRHKAQKQADREARAVRKAAATKTTNTLDSFINRVRYKPVAMEQQAKVAVGAKASAADRPPIGAASPKKKQRTPTKPARPSRIADMFDKAMPAELARPSQHDAVAHSQPAAEVAAEPVLRTPHLSGKFGAMGMASPAAAGAGQSPTRQPQSGGLSRARKQLFVAGPAASGSSEQASGQACRSASHNSQSGSDAAAGHAGIAPAGRAPHATAEAMSSEEMSWPETGSYFSSRRKEQPDVTGTAAQLQQPVQQQKPGRKAARSRLPEQRVARDSELQELQPSGAAKSGARQLTVARTQQVVGHAVMAAASVAAGRLQHDCSTPIDLITAERPPEVVDLTATSS